MKKMDSVEQTLIAMGFSIDENNQNYVRDDVTFSATEAIGHTVGSFLEKAKRRGWLEEEQVGIGKSMLLEPGMICKNNVVISNGVVGISVRHINDKQEQGTSVPPIIKNDKRRLEFLLENDLSLCDCAERGKEIPRGVFPNLAERAVFHFSDCERKDLEKIQIDVPKQSYYNIRKSFNFQVRDGELRLLKPTVLPVAGTLTAEGNAIEAARGQLGAGIPYVPPTSEAFSYCGKTYHYENKKLVRISITPEEKNSWEDTPYFWPTPWFPYSTD